tara:strand:- start:2979 stop:4481 length:1503 start_codon:yes stop_codon:yes gene_type:complete
VKHFAGKVTYKIEGFIQKNKDKVPEHLRAMCRHSINPVLRAVYTEIGASSSTKKKKMVQNTIATKFLGQLKALVKTTNSTKRHYIRCVKPNDHKLKYNQEGAFHAGKTLRQLKFAGILQAVQIRQEGYPFRETFKAFWGRAVQLGWTKLAGVRDERIDADDEAKVKEGIAQILDKAVDPALWRLGRTMVFGKDDLLRTIHEWHRANVAAKVQQYSRGRNGRVRFNSWRRERYAKRWASYGAIMKAPQAAVRAANAIRGIETLRAVHAAKMAKLIAAAKAMNEAGDAAARTARAAAEAVSAMANSAMEVAIAAGAAFALSSALRNAKQSAEFARRVALEADEAAQRAHQSALDEAEREAIELARRKAAYEAAITAAAIARYAAAEAQETSEIALLLAQVVATYDAVDKAVSAARASADAASMACDAAASSAEAAVAERQRQAAQTIGAFLADERKNVAFAKWIVEMEVACANGRVRFVSPLTRYVLFTHRVLVIITHHTYS